MNNKLILHKWDCDTFVIEFTKETKVAKLKKLGLLVYI